MRTPGLDNLIAESVASVITDQLGEPVLKDLEKRLRERYGISVIESIRDFGKMDATLREMFQDRADEVERHFLEPILSIDSSSRNKTWITIRDKRLVDLIMASFSDPEKRSILEHSMGKPEVIRDIIKKSNLSKSSGYRIAKDLAEKGLLAETGYEVADDGRKLSEYVPLIENMKIDLKGEKIELKVMINRDFFSESKILQASPDYLQVMNREINR